jgi:toxin FitB
MVKRAVPNVVDSSAWLAYFADESTAATFAPAIENVRDLVVPAICLLEVFTVVTHQRGDGPALQAVAVMQQGQVIDLDAALAVAAAAFGAAHGLPLADSVVYATARAVGGVVWTQDADLDGLDGVRYVPKEGVTRAR